MTRRTILFWGIFNLFHEKHEKPIFLEANFLAKHSKEDGDWECQMIILVLPKEIFSDSKSCKTKNSRKYKIQYERKLKILFHSLRYVNRWDYIQLYQHTFHVLLTNLTFRKRGQFTTTFYIITLLSPLFSSSLRILALIHAVLLPI